MDLRDRVAIVTGATGALGKVVTRDLAAVGARLGLLGTRIDRLEALAAELALDPDRWHGQAVDLKDPDATAVAVQAVVARFGRADILVHVVGGWSGGTTVTDTPLDAFTSMLDQHLWTTLHVTRALVPHLAAGGWGRIVAISSPVASNPPAKMSAYAVGKAAQEALLATLSHEVADSGTTVNMLLVRTIDTEHVRDSDPTQKNASWTTPEEISAVLGYLLSDEGHVVNGARIPLYGSA
jgi:NAD(P)-dependent dehydrogenase (short-subunit alcohol dehydrogenase family)